jgi:hypothetical protein
METDVQHGSPLTVCSREGRLGLLKAVLWEPRLLLLESPQGPGRFLLIPFEAIEQLDRDRRTILLRPAREALDLAAARADRLRDGD